MYQALCTFLLMSFSLSFFGQELWLNEKDDFTGDVKKATTKEVIGDNGEKNGIKVSFGAMRVADTKAFFLNSSYDLGCAGGVGCFAMLKFSDDEVLKLEDQADVDCSDGASSMFLVSAELLARIEAKDAPVMIRLSQTDHYTDAKEVNAELWNAHWAAVLE